MTAAVLAVARHELSHEHRFNRFSFSRLPKNRGVGESVIPPQMSLRTAARLSEDSRIPLFECFRGRRSDQARANPANPHLLFAASGSRLSDDAVIFSRFQARKRWQRVLHCRSEFRCPMRSCSFLHNEKTTNPFPNHTVRVLTA